MAMSAPPQIISETKRRSEPPWLGGVAACMAVCITHPIDQTKIRKQTQSIRLSVLDTARASIRSNGVLGLWDGLSGSLLRQATYGAARFGIYGHLKETNFTGGSLVLNGAISGIVAGIVGAPAEVILVRMCSDINKPLENRLNYKNCIDGLLRISKEEGITKTFRGLSSTLSRSVVMNASQLSCYDTFKSLLCSTGHFQPNETKTHLLSSALGGTVAVTLVAPIDVIKSRVQSSTGSLGPIQALRELVKNDGPHALFRGWVPAWLRMAPTTMLTFVFLEQLRGLWMRSSG